MSYAAPTDPDAAPHTDVAASTGSDTLTDVFVGHEPSLDADDAADSVREMLALIAYQHPVMLELDDSMTALRAAVEPLLDSGKTAGGPGNPGGLRARETVNTCTS